MTSKFAGYIVRKRDSRGQFFEDRDALIHRNLCIRARPNGLTCSLARKTRPGNNRARIGPRDGPTPATRPGAWPEKYKAQKVRCILPVHENFSVLGLPNLTPTRPSPTSWPPQPPPRLPAASVRGLSPRAAGLHVSPASLLFPARRVAGRLLLALPASRRVAPRPAPPSRAAGLRSGPL